MANPKETGSAADGSASLKSVQDKAELLKASLEDRPAASVFQQAGAKKVSSAAAPNPAVPLDESVLENIGIVGKGSDFGKNVASSSAASVTSLSDVKDTVSAASGGIKVDPDYKPAFQSSESSTLSASMNKSGNSVLRSAPSLQSRLESDQNKLYRPSSSDTVAGNNQKLGGGFRVAEDPNMTTPPSGSGYSAMDRNSSFSQSQAPGGQPPGSSGGGSSGETVHHYEENKGKGGLGAGAIGMLGGLLVAGGVGAVVLKPDLLSTTGGVKQAGSIQNVSVSRQPSFVPWETAQPAATYNNTPPAQNRRVAAVAMIPRPAQPAVAPTGGGVALAAQDSSAATGKDVPVYVSVQNMKPEDDQYIRIGGMPDNATLSDGLDMGDGNWLLAPAVLKDLKLTTADNYKGTLKLYTQLIKNDAKSPIGSPKTFSVFIGVAPPRQQVAAVAPQRAAFTPAQVQPQRRAQPAPVARIAPRAPNLPTGLPLNEDNENFGALPGARANKYERPRANQKRAAAPARAPRALRESIPVGRMFSRQNYGRTAEPIQQQRVASASPQRTVPQISDQRARILLKRGNNLYRLGDLVSARSLYGQVAATGNPDAAMAMGRTYDPIYFEKLGVQGFKPEPGRAMEWYKKAKSAGLFKAQQKIDNLKYFLQQ